MTTPVLRTPRFLRVVAAILAGALMSSCGGGDDTPSAPNGFQGNVASAVALAGAPRVAASSADGNTWVAWVEGDGSNQTLVGARINSVGVITRRPVVSGFAGVVRDVSITMVGASPLLTWRQYATSGAVFVAAAGFDGVEWVVDYGQAASGQGDVRTRTLPDASVLLEWTRLDVSGRFQLVAARRAASGVWAGPVVVRSGDAGATLRRSALSTDGVGAMALWSEQAASSAAEPPEVLWSARYDAATAAWSAPVTIDSGATYPSLAIGSTEVAGWVAVWLQGTALGRSAIVGKRYAQGAWSTATDRIDAGQDATINELVLASRNHRVVVGWVGLPLAGTEGGSVRASAFDASAPGWQAPALVGGATSGYPIGLALRADGAGASAAAWSVSQGTGGLQLAATDAIGIWQPASSLDPDGLSPDLDFFAPADRVVTWDRPVAGGAYDIAVQRRR